MYPTSELEKQFRSAQAKAAQAHPYQPGHLFLGHVYGKSGRPIDVGIPTKRHAITIGGARSGKGVAVIIPNLLKWPHNAVVIDPKGEAAEATAEARVAMGQHVGVLDPFGVAKVPDRLRVTFNPLAGIDPKGLTSREDIEVIADGMVKRSNPHHAEWDDGAAALLAGVIAYVVADAPPEHRNMAVVRSVLLQPDEALYQDAQRMLAVDACGGLAKATAVTLMSALRSSEKSMEKDFLEGARRHSKWVDSPAIAPTLASTTFDLRELKTGKATLYLVLPPQYLLTHAAFLRLFVRAAIHTMASSSRSGEQCLFMLDEFHSLGRIEEIEKAAGLMPGYGVKLWPILQDLNQLTQIYGDAAGTFFANADLHQFFANTDPDTLRHISLRLGSTTTADIPLPPAAPMMSGGGPSIFSAMSSQSKDSTIRGMGAAWGAFSSGLDSMAQAAEAAEYQNKMNEYQRQMAKLGQPRVPPEHVAALVQLKDDIVADGSISFVYGSEYIYSHLSPHFRSASSIQNSFNSNWNAVSKTVLCIVAGYATAAISSVIFGTNAYGVVALVIGIAVSAILIFGKKLLRQLYPALIGAAVLIVFFGILSLSRGIPILPLELLTVAIPSGALLGYIVNRFLGGFLAGTWSTLIPKVTDVVRKLRPNAEK